MQIVMEVQSLRFMKPNCIEDPVGIQTTKEELERRMGGGGGSSALRYDHTDTYIRIE